MFDEMTTEEQVAKNKAKRVVLECFEDDTFPQVMNSIMNRYFMKGVILGSFSFAGLAILFLFVLKILGVL